MLHSSTDFLTSASLLGTVATSVADLSQLVLMQVCVAANLVSVRLTSRSVVRVSGMAATVLSAMHAETLGRLLKLVGSDCCLRPISVNEDKFVTV